MSAHHLVGRMRAQIVARPDDPAMHDRVDGKWRTITYGEVGKRVDAVASWLIRAGVGPGDRVAILAPNSPMWSIADLASLFIGAVVVPIYPTSTADQVAHLLSDAGAAVVFVGTRELYATLALARPSASPLTHIVAFDPRTQLDGSDSVHFADVLAEPVDKALADRVEAATTADIATIIYTSGTTGEPKGVVLSHANLAMQFEALDQSFSVSRQDTSLCFLPLSHTYERAWTYYVLLKGARNFYLEDPKAIMEAFRDVRPTCMVSVPRLYEKIHATAQHRLQHASAVRRAVFEWAVRIGSRVAHARKRGERVGVLLSVRHRLADRLVLRKIRDIVGGPKNFFSAGGAALSCEIEEFFFAAGLLVCQGYGLTETSPMLSCNRPGEFKFGTVGKPIPGCEIRIAADGEILARGANVMRGYHRQPAATAEAFEDGWFKTGDIGAFDADGFLMITDRKKDLIITSGGKNIAPSRIESVIGNDYYIEQVAAVGEGRHYLSALVVPHFDAVEEWARTRGLTFDSMRALVRDHRVIAFIAERIEARQAELAHHERVKKFTLLSERFSQMGGEITPTLKNIRSAIAEKYAHLIEAMYSGHASDDHRDKP